MSPNQDSIDPILHCCLDFIHTRNESIASVLDRFPKLSPLLRMDLEAALWLMLQIPTLEPSNHFLIASSHRVKKRIQQEHSMQSKFLRLFSHAPGLDVSSHGTISLLTFTLLFVISLIFGSSGLVLASVHSLPNDSSYPVKAVLEWSALVITPGTKGDLRLHMEYARRRLQEIESLVMEGRGEWVSVTTARFITEAGSTMEGLEKLSTRDRAAAKKLAAVFRQQLQEHNKSILLIQPVAPKNTQAAIEATAQEIQAVLNALETFGGP